VTPSAPAKGKFPSSGALPGSGNGVLSRVVAVPGRVAPGVDADVGGVLALPQMRAEQHHHLAPREIDPFGGADPLAEGEFEADVPGAATLGEGGHGNVGRTEGGEQREKVIGGGAVGKEGNGLGAVLALDGLELGSHQVERLVPARLAVLPRAAGAGADRGVFRRLGS
jgi:hypothetical protein